MMLTEQGQLAAHMAAELAEQFARRHAAQGHHDQAEQNYREAATLYVECGCEVMCSTALARADHEAELHRLYWVAP